MSRRVVSLILLRPPVITWPERLHYEWGTCTGAIRRLRLEIVNIETMHQLLVVEYFKRSVCLFHFFLNDNRFEKTVTDNIKADCCKFVFF
jgi:hypothetical protein